MTHVPALAPVASPRLRQIVVETLRAMRHPRRMLPLVFLGTTLVVAQAAASWNLRAGLVGIIIIGATVLVAPCAWRWALETPASPAVRVRRVALFVALGAVMIPSLAFGLGWAFQLKWQFLTEPTILLVSVALYIVGGWGLGRDIALEAYLERERARARDLEQAAEHAQLLAMRAHLDPHFLFNTLNAIAEWCRQDGAVAESAVLMLASMLRTILEGIKSPTWPLARELELVHTLFQLHQLRDPGRFELIWRVPEPLPSLQVPPMLLMPLAENAMKHGPSAGHRGAVRLELRARGGTELVVELENPGRSAGDRPGSSGLPTLRRRLAVAYGAAAHFELTPRPDSTQVTVTLPIRYVPERAT